MKPKFADVPRKAKIKAGQGETFPVLLLDEICEGYEHKSKVAELYEKNRKRLVAWAKENNIFTFKSSRKVGKKLTLVAKTKTMLDQEKLKAHFGGVIPDQFMSECQYYELEIEDQ